MASITFRGSWRYVKQYLIWIISIALGWYNLAMPFYKTRKGLEASTTDTKLIKRELYPDDQARSLISRLWLQSRLKYQPTEHDRYTRKGYDRPMTLENVYIAFRLVRASWRPFYRSVIKDAHYELLLYVLTDCVKGLRSTVVLWAQMRLMNLVQDTVRQVEVSRLSAIKMAFLVVIANCSSEIITFVRPKGVNSLESIINHRMEYEYLKAKTSLSHRSITSPFVSALLHEAGVCTGLNRRHHSGTSGESSLHHRPFAVVKQLCTFLTGFVDITSSNILLVRTIVTESNGGDRDALTALALLPTGIRLLRDWVKSAGADSVKRSQSHAAHRQKDRYNDIAHREAYRQETILYGLGDWILTQWTEAALLAETIKFSRKEWARYAKLGLAFAEESVDQIFDVMLVLGYLGPGSTLGNTLLYRDISNSFIYQAQSLKSDFIDSFQLIFYLAAYIETVSDLAQVERSHYERKLGLLGPMVNYETIRNPIGMSIHARSLSFTYPGAASPTLHNIDFSIEPGQVLAIVGLNGGGKTSLVKALMGMYEYEGDIYVNGVSMREIDPATLHRRTSCLFQDFSKYALSLGTNVALGDVSRSVDKAGINMALLRGGAEAVRQKIGLGRILEPTGEADAEDDSPPAEDQKALGGNEAPAHEGGASNSATYPSETNAKPAHLSGGQWQRVALSRAFLRSESADLVVFDEPSASLDPQAEADLFERIHALSQAGGRRATTIYISHRFSTVRKADQIAVVDEGRIVEVGSHGELMALDGRYAKLFNLQKGGYQD